MYNKLFTKILDSSIWLENDATVRVWITLIASMDEDGFCGFASPRNLANRSCVEISAAEKAIEILSSPDPNSSDPDNEGKRIERVPGGYIVINAVKYREQVTRVEVKKLNRARVARYRQREAGAPVDPSPNVEGYVYYVRSGENVKIGFSKNPWSRLKEIRIHNPLATLLAFEKGTYITEKERHDMFAEFLVSGEWFAFSDAIKEHIKPFVVENSELRNDDETLRNEYVMQSKEEAVAVTNKKYSSADAEEIYREYPKKAGKEAALKAILKAMNKLRADGQPDPKSFLISRVKAHAANVRSLGTEDKYIKYPQGWFNDGSYHDEHLELRPQFIRVNAVDEIRERNRKAMEEKLRIEGERRGQSA